MLISQYVKTIYPQNIQGLKMADEMEKKLRDQGCFRSRKEDTQGIIIDAEYFYSVKDE